MAKGLEAGDDAAAGLAGLDGGAEHENLCHARADGRAGWRIPSAYMRNFSWIRGMHCLSWLWPGASGWCNTPPVWVVWEFRCLRTLRGECHAHPGQNRPVVSNDH
ncbi:hypothetical protein GCM10018779_15120 [Streptomyces griseocarneus]|nr:hypothetical protein GCM10018779_15120 [Streptomyces griseocarneus]